MKYSNLLKTQTGSLVSISYHCLVFIFKTELTTIDDISSILDSFFESMDLKTRKDDHYDSKYNWFNFALKTTKILTNDVKIQDFNQKMEIVQKLVSKFLLIFRQKRKL